MPSKIENLSGVPNSAYFTLAPKWWDKDAVNAIIAPGKENVAKGIKKALAKLKPIDVTSNKTIFNTAMKKLGSEDKFNSAIADIKVSKMHQMVTNANELKESFDAGKLEVQSEVTGRRGAVT